MITLVEALRFRSLKHVHQPLGHFEVLAGPHASGKTAFLDTIAILGRLVSGGLEAALPPCAADFPDLVWMRAADSFELAIEVRIPEERRVRLPNPEYGTVRYEVALGLEPDHRAPAILEEKVLLRASLPGEQPLLFPAPPGSLMTSKRGRAVKTVIHKNPGGNDNFYDESGKGWDHAFRLGRHRSALGNLPDDEAKFPIATWLKDLLATGVRRLTADAPCPAAIGGWFDDWRRRMLAALPALEDIRPSGEGWLMRYRGGFEAPAAMASAGTRRLMALTLAVRAGGLSGIWLAEDPESGLDPCAAEALMDALAAVSGAQVLAATSSPAVLAHVAPENVLRFATTQEGATVISRAG
jgi:hypothetical protein